MSSGMHSSQYFVVVLCCVQGTMSFGSNTVWFILVHLSVFSAATSSDAHEFRNDYEYFPDAGGWFKLHRVPLDWDTARMQCYYEGAVLASPLNSKMWTVMKKIVSEAKPYNADIFYSGVHSTFSNGVFSSVEGIPLENLFVKWLPYQPNNLEHSQCIAFNENGMNNCKCSERLPYICFRKLSISDQLAECGTVDREYKLDARTGHCYKVHRVAQSWARALRVCQAEGGHLAVIDSELEADVLRDLFALHPHLLYTRYQNSAAVGFAQWGPSKSWWTIHGKLLEDSGYAQWSRGQPDNAPAPGGGGSPQACGAIFRVGRLDDVWCDEPLAFICEKTKRSLLLTEQAPYLGLFPPSPPDVLMGKKNPIELTLLDSIDDIE